MQDEFVKLVGAVSHEVVQGAGDVALIRRTPDVLVGLSLNPHL